MGELVAQSHHIKDRRWAGVALASAVAMLAGSATAQSQAAGNRAAYDVALKCFVANGKAKEDRRGAGDASGAARYDTQAKHAFDTAVLLGTALGYSNDQMNRDIGSTLDRELPLMVRSPEYFRQSVADCRAYGLM